MQCLRVFCNQCKQNILDDNALLRQLMPLPQLRYHRMYKFLKKKSIWVFFKTFFFQQRFHDLWQEKFFKNKFPITSSMWIYMAQFEMRKLPNNLLLLENHSFEIFYTFYYVLPAMSTQNHPWFCNTYIYRLPLFKFPVTNDW